MNCPNCGKTNPDGTSFCGNCGTRLNPSSVPNPPIASQPASKKKALNFAYILIPITIISIIVSLVFIVKNRPKVNKFPPLSSIGAQQQSDELNQAKYFTADMQLSHYMDSKQATKNLHNTNPNSSPLSTKFTTPYTNGIDSSVITTAWVALQANNPVHEILLKIFF